MSACRYEQGPCTFPTSMRRHHKCQDGSCPEQAGRMCSRPEGEAAEGKSTLVYVASAPEPQEARVDTLPRSTHLPKPRKSVGQCGRCGKEASLGTSKHAPGMHLCVSCTVRAFKRSKKGLPLDKAGGEKRGRRAASASPAAAAPKEPRPDPIAKQGPTAAVKACHRCAKGPWTVTAEGEFCMECGRKVRDRPAAGPAPPPETSAYLAAIGFLERRMAKDQVALGVLRELVGMVA